MRLVPFSLLLSTILLACGGGGAVDAPSAPPIITRFSASPTAIAAGDGATLGWEVTGATGLSISGLGVVSGASVQVSPATTTTYTLTAANSAGDATAAATVTVFPAPSGQVTLDACLGLAGVQERCTLVTNGSACLASRCSRLVVVFSGGEQGCATGAGYASVLAGFAAHGYAAVCINTFETSAGSGTVPYLDEAERFDAAVREATTGPWAQRYWTGEHLLLEGVSHGATAPVILMARTALEAQAHWHGSRSTGGCFFDGSYDQVATAELLRTGALGGAACTSPVPYLRWLERYCGPGATAATCDLATHAKAQADGVAAALPATFAIQHFKLFECGSALPACAGDIIPAAPIQALCGRLEASPDQTCSFTSLPTDGHLTCHANNYDQCRTWFEGLPPP